MAPDAPGDGGLALRALAREVGMRQPSLYEYFDSKNALFDAMFADGNRQLFERLQALELPDDPRLALKMFMRALAQFALEDDARHLLLFQRPIPGFVPTPGVLFARKDRRADLRAGMQQTLERLRDVVECKARRLRHPPDPAWVTSAL